MPKYYQMESNEGNVTVFVPDGNVQNVESGLPVSFIANAPLFIKMLNENYGESLLHYQSAERVDVQRLIVRTVRQYLNAIEGENANG